MSNRNDFGDSFTIELKPDKDGYIGRECPASNCLGYFKVTFGTGIKGPAPCHCPYCGHSGDHQTFFTQAQLDYINSVALRKVDEVISRELKSLEFEHKPEVPFGIGISLTFKESPAPPIRHYREKKLETEIICENCTLRYAIYGVFAWCPDCGIHNSLQMLLKNLELAKKELELSESIGTDLSDHLIKEALSTIVAAVDGFGREICSQSGAADIRFQNLTAARKKVRSDLGSILPIRFALKSGSNYADCFRSDTFWPIKWASWTPNMFGNQRTQTPRLAVRFSSGVTKSVR